jgi:metal-sulfur cluster biosynthetic enzyme
MNLQPDDAYYRQTQQAIEALKKVIDPELFVNIIDLGLVYHLDFSQSGKIGVSMTLSTPHCPLGEAITNGVENALQDEFPERKTTVDLVWEPAWSFDMMTEEGRKELGV